ncbi:alpha/beta hydrolase [Paucibacter sp. APW11]|uniref:Alpha/beta hydrolase n=1 Tax=Roseateles aquae TaxID=3077235 RepID=A0ABU3PG98_9BURK|nr:alpha/beta hydrolase [Paucibacter sp. APW11]MDT9001637.1 alpha/beta hydrolase [Paucibacter sp. APW11]
MKSLRYCQLGLALLLLLAGGAHAAGCGERVLMASHGGTQMAYALAAPEAGPARAVVVLLPGGGGHAKLGADGCARALTGNVLVRIQPQLRAQGLVTVLVDAPSDYQGEDGLAGFREASAHAEDIGLLIRQLRERLPGLPVWLLGTSRGTISAANAAARLSGPAAADGLILSSVLSQGQAQARKAWVAQSVFDLPLEAIRQPVLLLGHRSDGCQRSPPALLPKVAARLSAAARLQQQLIEGGPLGEGSEACEGRSPHGYIGQEDELIAAMRDFMALP